MNTHKFLWVLIVWAFSVVGCVGSSSTPPTPFSPSRSTPHLVEPTATKSVLPDLTIQDIDFEPAPTATGDGRQLLMRGITYSITVHVMNIGKGPVRGAVAVDAPYGCLGQGQAPNLLFAGNDLAPGESRPSNSFSVTLRTDSGGSCTFEFNVDPDNVQAESDESLSSNTREATFEVP
jgi:hypothetical protein